MRGRPRKPVEAKILAGTFREDRDGPACAAVPAAGEPVRPQALGPVAAAFWGEVVPGLVERRVVGASDTAALVSLVEWWACYRANMDALVSLPAAALGTKAARILQIAAAEASRQFQLFACRFGLTPADRARLKVDPQKKPTVASRTRGA